MLLKTGLDFIYLFPFLSTKYSLKLLCKTNKDHLLCNRLCRKGSGQARGHLLLEQPVGIVWVDNQSWKAETGNVPFCFNLTFLNWFEENPEKNLYKKWTYLFSSFWNERSTVCCMFRHKPTNPQTYYCMEHFFSHITVLLLVEQKCLLKSNEWITKEECGR